MPTIGDAEFDEMPGHLIRRAQQLHIALWNEVGPPDLTSPQFAVLAVLHQHPLIDQTELSTRSSLDRSTLAEMVSRMVRRRLIDRERDPADGRRNVLQLSPLGHEVYAAALEPTREVNRRLVASLDSDERLALRRLLRLVLGVA